MFALPLVSFPPRCCISPIYISLPQPPPLPTAEPLANHYLSIQLLAAGSITLINGAPVSAPLSDLVERAASSHSLNSRSPNPDPSVYVEVFSGTGALSQGWPAVDQWIPSFDDM